MNIEEKMLTEVVLMNYSSSEEKVMKKLDVIWLKSKDLRHKNVLAYSTNIMVTDINESCPRKLGVLEILCQSDRIYNSKGLDNESNT